MKLPPRLGGIIGAAGYGLGLVLRHTTEYGESIFQGVLCLPFIAIGIILWIRKRRQANKAGL